MHYKILYYIVYIISWLFISFILFIFNSSGDYNFTFLIYDAHAILHDYCTREIKKKILQLIAGFDWTAVVYEWKNKNIIMTSILVSGPIISQMFSPICSNLSSPSDLRPVIITRMYSYDDIKSVTLHAKCVVLYGSYPII